MSASGGTKWETLIMFLEKEMEIETRARKMINIILYILVDTDID